MNDVRDIRSTRSIATRGAPNMGGRDERSNRTGGLTGVSGYESPDRMEG